jgi:uncharacterized protein
VSDERLDLHTADGETLEAEIHVPDDHWGAVVLCHPHPEYGGSMRDGLPDLLHRSLPGRGLASLRFNFRGVQGSSGRFDGGAGERLDVTAAVEAASADTGGVPLLLCGYSFGADVALTVGDGAIDGWLAVAPPLRAVPLAEMVAASDSRPLLVLSPEHDQYCPPERARTATEGWEATDLEVLPGTDHFLLGAAGTIEERAVAFTRALAGG